MFAFGGVYGWAVVPFLGGCLLLALSHPPPLARAGRDQRLDRALLVLLGAATLQLLPAPAALVDVVSPGTAALLRAVDLGFAPGAPGGAGPRMLATSIDPLASVWATAVLLGALVIFAVARAELHGRSLRLVVRGVAWLGLVVGLVALAQKTTSDRLVYWWWEPFDEGGTPFGPFINRNHFGTWAVMTIPLCLGYGLARLQALGSPGRRPIAGLPFRFDERAAFMVLVATVLSVAVVTSLSRSALLGLALACALLVVLSPGERNKRRRAWLTAYILVTALGIVTWVNAGELVGRLDETLVAPRQRLIIWRESIPIVRDFWLTGTGTGTYEKAMLLYQETNRRWSFNQAHSHYVQVLVEGGLLLTVPVAVALAALVARIRHALAADRSPVFWIRAGATAGLAAVALQSVWETGLRMPANAAMAAVLAAIALHPPPDPSAPGEDDAITSGY